MVTCSAPGKIYLFGEHAVVYGESAVACAVELRTRVTVVPAESTSITSGGQPLAIGEEPYIQNTLKIMEEFLALPPVSIRIDSEIPIAAGIGSSAALTVALLRALSIEFGVEMDLSLIAATAHRIERLVQGAASPTDTFVSTMGGVVVVPERRHLPPPGCKIVIGDAGIGTGAGAAMREKTGEMVLRVADLREAYPDAVDPVISAIGGLARSGVLLLEEGDCRGVGKLMNINHGLLEALGVGTTRLLRLVHAARDAGAFGAKITGAGGGGCMVALADNAREVAQGIERAGGKAMVVEIAQEGVRKE
ncbi:mevalonate kinase [Methanosarcinales archaeon ex4572_44]|nr:MAG: mevalonate kinase [Methanosarcinales archaeon ex4484_138]PHP45676.1 MAG: mevalonate kinase [Methanosarcinales archaeon ex4572_44]